MAKPKVLEIHEGRVSEQYILTQIDYHYDEQSFRDWKDSMEDGDRLYRGKLNELFPDEQDVPDVPYVENKFKNALHDLSRLASEGRGSVKAIPRGDKDRDMKQARLREAVAEGYWIANKMKRKERQLYLDMAGSAMMATALYYNDASPYPQARILNPRFCWPDVREGELYSMFTVEEIKERVLGWQYPEFGLNTDGDNADTVLFACYYDAKEVAEAVVYKQNQKPSSARIVRRWVHDLGTIPVAFEMLDTYDRTFHGLFDQLGGPLMVRNKTVRYLIDYLEQMAHAPIFEMNVVNWDAEPGPLTVYHGDPNADPATVKMERIPPAATSQGVFGLLSYMGDQEEKEALQPPARSGNVSQSIASGSFVDRTQGQLTSVVKELQDKMSSLREQFNDIAFRIDERWMDNEKPLIRPIAGKGVYTPSKDIGGWYFHEVKFGAGAGLDRLNADTRVLNHLAARLISREEARAEIDYLDDSASSQDKIDRENLADAILQRFVRDPSTPMSAIAKTWLIMKTEGKSLDEALEVTVPDLLAAEQAAQGMPPEGMPPEEAAAMGGAQELQQVALQGPPLAQLFPGRNFR